MGLGPGRAKLEGWVGGGQRSGCRSCPPRFLLLPEPPPLPFTLKSQQVLAEPLCLLDGVFPIFLRCVWCLTDWWGS